MKTSTFEVEGTWEEILQHVQGLEGKRVRVQVMSEQPDIAAMRPDERRKLMMESFQRFKAIKLDDEDLKALEEFETFRKEHPVRFRMLEDLG